VTVMAFPMTSSNFAHDRSVRFQADAYDFEGIVQLSNCSGALVRFENSGATDRALVMTNGHCVPVNGGLMPPNSHIHNRPTSRQFSILSRDGSSRIGTVTSTKIVYATMTGTDLALYELNETYEQISSKHSVDALTLSSNRPIEGAPIEIISGYWRRGYDCALDGFVYELREAGYKFSDSIRYEVNGGCKTIHGTSGSPIIAAGTRVAIGVNNTGSDDGEQCTMNNPCEVNEEGQVFAEKGRSYGQQIHQLYSCLNLSHQIDLNMEGCQLFKNQ
jgi:V8-like Glu-specific endopeptidase